jgi:hypothetical protein
VLGPQVGEPRPTVKVGEVEGAVGREREPEGVPAVRVHTDVCDRLARDHAAVGALLALIVEPSDGRVADRAAIAQQLQGGSRAIARNGSSDKLRWKNTGVRSLPVRAVDEPKIIHPLAPG